MTVPLREVRWRQQKQLPFITRSLHCRHNFLVPGVTQTPMWHCGINGKGNLHLPGAHVLHNSKNNYLRGTYDLCFIMKLISFCRAQQSSDRWQTRFEDKCQEVKKLEISLNLAKSALSRLEKEKRVLLARLNEVKSKSRWKYENCGIKLHLKFDCLSRGCIRSVQ